MNLIKLLSLLLLVSNVYGMSADEEKKYDELEGLPFIHALTQDKNYAEVIKQYPAVAKEKSELGLFHYYLADAHFNLKQYPKASEILEQGSKYKTPKMLYYNLWGRTSFKLKNYNQCSRHFEKSGIKNLTGQDWVMYVDCLKNNKEMDRILALALNHQSPDFDFFYAGQKFLISQGLRSFAKSKRHDFLATCKEPMIYLKTWALMEKVNERDLEVLEAAHRCHPKDLEISGTLVKNLFTEGKYHSIAYIFDQLSQNDPTYYKHAAEFYKVAGREMVGEYFNILGDETGFVLSKSAKFLNAENYAGLLTIPFRAETLKGNKDLAYAIAYSQFKYLSLHASKQTLLSQSKQNSKDQALLGLIEKCQELDWRCRP